MPGNLIKLRFTLNEKPQVLQCHPAARLLDVLRREFGLKETREGCSRGECGACLVLMNGVAVSSCLVPAFALSDAEVLTIEGIRSLKSFADIRKRLPDAEAFRCGHCATGMQIALTAALLADPEPGASEIRAALAGTLCACGSYANVVDSLRQRTGRKRRYGTKGSERT
jgi:carbon-monoxide dehydrogenase small subunit